MPLISAPSKGTEVVALQDNIGLRQPDSPVDHG